MATSDTTADVTIGGEYWDAQLDTFAKLDSGDYDLVVFRAGYAGGKTLLACDWILSVAVETPKSDNLLMAPDFAKGGPSTFKKLFERLPGENTVPDEGGDPEDSPIVADYNRVEKRLTIINGAIVRLGSADKWNRYAGSEFNAIACDEPAHYDTTNLYDLVEMLTSRQRTHAGPNTMLWTSTGAGFNQFYDITERQVQPDGDGGEEPLGWRDRMAVVVGDTRNNPFLPEDAREKFLSQYAGTAREEQALAGGFAAPTGLVYGDFSRERHVRPDDALADRLRDGWRIYGYDHGWDDPRVVLEVGKTEYGQLVVVDEFYHSGVEYQRAVAWLTDHDKPKGTIYAEHEPEHQRAFKAAGYPVEPAVKDLDEGIPAVRDRLDWRDDPKDRPGLLIAESCTHTIRELQDYQEEEVGTSAAVDHAADCLRYLVMGEDHDDGDPGAAYASNPFA